MSAAELAQRAHMIAAETSHPQIETLAEIVAELAESNALTEPAAIATIRVIDRLHTNYGAEGEKLDHCYHCMWSWPCPTRQTLGLS